jgi:hypothetical protein
VTQFFNPKPSNIETVINRWLPVFTYTTNRAIEEAYDIGTTNAIPLKNIVFTGYSMRINVTAINIGDFTETFNVTLYANTTEIQTKTVTLGSQDQANITFTWDTHDFAKGNCTISAHVIPILGETRTANNNFTDSWVAVSMVGDLTCDGLVDITDVAMVAYAFGSPGANPDRYQTTLDVNDDGTIDITDVATVAFEFGKSDS